MELPFRLEVLGGLLVEAGKVDNPALLAVFHAHKHEGPLLSKEGLCVCEDAARKGRIRSYRRLRCLRTQTTAAKAW